MLSVTNHDRELDGFTYVYPVLSRRAGGVSVGINLNPNHACNWRCVYCQVPGLQRGKAPSIDLIKLEKELLAFLVALISGEWLAHNAPEGTRVLKDIAFSGDGEPTSAREFADAVACVVRLHAEFGFGQNVALRLITNGSLMAQRSVREGVRRLGKARGEVWFKVDGGTVEDIERINGIRIKPQVIASNLALCSSLCPTWAQLCVFRQNGLAPTEAALEAWLELLRAARREGAEIEGVLLYGPVRKPMQPEGADVCPLDMEEFAAIAARIKDAGWPVRASY